MGMGGVGCEARERRLLRCWGALGTDGDGRGRGGRRLAVLCVSAQQQLVGLAGRDGGVSAAEMGATRGDPPAPCRVGGHPRPAAWGSRRATPWGRVGNPHRGGQKGMGSVGCRGSEHPPYPTPAPAGLTYGASIMHLSAGGRRAEISSSGAGGPLTPEGPRTDPALVAPHKSHSAPRGTSSRPPPLQLLTRLGQDGDLLVRQTQLLGEPREPLQALGTDLLRPACDREQGEGQPPAPPGERSRCPGAPAAQQRTGPSARGSPPSHPIARVTPAREREGRPAEELPGSAGAAMGWAARALGGRRTVEQHHGGGAGALADLRGHQGVLVVVGVHHADVVLAAPLCGDREDAAQPRLPARRSEGHGAAGLGAGHSRELV